MTQTQFNRENPPPKTPTVNPVTADKAQQVKDNAAKYGPEYGVDDAEFQRIVDRRGSKPPRIDSPAQTQQAASGAQNAQTSMFTAENTAAHNARQDDNATVTQQREALQAQGLLYQNIRNQEINAAQTNVQAQTAYQTNAREAGQAVLGSLTTQRGQDLQHQEARQKFIQDVITTAMPKVAELMMNTPKGSKIPQNFLMGFLALANDAAEKAGLNKEIPPVDMNSPLVRSAVQYAQTPIPNVPPKMPDTQSTNWDTARAMAVGGFPVNGWQGPIGSAATQVPAMPSGTKADGSNPQQAAATSKEGQAIQAKYEGILAVQNIDPYNPKNAAEKAKVDQARAAAQKEIQGLASSQQTAKTTTDPALSEAQKLRNDVRATLVSGEPQARLGSYGEILAAQEALKQGKTLTASQQALMANVDQKDLDIINQNLSPLMPLINSRAKNEPLTDEQNQQLDNAFATVSNGMKQRDVPPSLIPMPETTPKPVVPTQAPSALTPGSRDVPGQTKVYDGQPVDFSNVTSREPTYDEQSRARSELMNQGQKEYKPVNTYDAPDDIPDLSSMAQQYDQQQQQAQPQQEDIPDLSAQYSTYQDDEEERRRKQREQGLFNYNWSNV